MEFICQECKCVFTDENSTRRKKCDECIKKGKLRRKYRNRAYHKEQVWKKAEAERPKPEKSLSQMAAEAKEHGMSYGQYVLYLEKLKLNYESLTATE